MTDYSADDLRKIYEQFLPQMQDNFFNRSQIWQRMTQPDRLAEPELLTYDKLLGVSDKFPNRAPETSPTFFWRMPVPEPFTETPWRQPTTQLVNIKYALMACSIVDDMREDSRQWLSRSLFSGMADKDLMSEVRDIIKEVYQTRHSRKDLRRLKRWDRRQKLSKEVQALLEVWGKNLRKVRPNRKGIKLLYDYARLENRENPALAKSILKLIASLKEESRLRWIQQQLSASTPMEPSGDAVVDSSNTSASGLHGENEVGTGSPG